MSVCSAEELFEDFEEELEKFTISKRTVKDPRSKHRVYEFAPLSLCDVERLRIVQFPFSHVLEERIFFRKCVLYASVVGCLQGNNHFFKYLIDDGTAVVGLSVPQRKKEMKQLRLIEDKLDIAKIGKNSHGHLLLSMLKKQDPRTNIPIGTKIIVTGRISCFRNQIGIVSYTVFRDVGKDRSLETAFKDYFLNWNNKNS